MLVRPLTGRIINNKGSCSRRKQPTGSRFVQRKVGVDHPNPFPPGHQPLLIVAEDIEGEALVALVPLISAALDAQQAKKLTNK